MLILSKQIKTKLLNNEYLTKEEINELINYIIYKSSAITKYFPKEDYTQINLINEIFWANNIESTLYHSKNTYYCIANINNQDYLIDINLKNNKYIELTSDIYNEYLKTIGSDNYA